MMQRRQRNPRAAVVCRVLAQREPAIQLQIVDRREPAVLVRHAAGALFELLSIFRLPPITQISLRIVLAALIVKSMRELMPDDHADTAKIRGVICLLVE